MVRLGKLICLWLLCCSFLPHGSGSPANQSDPLAILLTSMTAGQWQRLDDGTYAGNVLPACTAANYSGNGVNDAWSDPVPGVPYGPCPPGGMWAYSIPRFGLPMARSAR